MPLKNMMYAFTTNGRLSTLVNILENWYTNFLALEGK
jgi:hypothetical protein